MDMGPMVVVRLRAVFLWAMGRWLEQVCWLEWKYWSGAVLMRAWRTE